MVKVVFRNLANSEVMKNVIKEKVNHILSKFPNLDNSMATVIVGQGHSPTHASSDNIQIKLILTSRGFKPVVLSKEGESATAVIALLFDRLFEVVHRALERRREKTRSARRRWKGSPHLRHEWRAAG